MKPLLLYLMVLTLFVYPISACCRNSMPPLSTDLCAANVCSSFSNNLLRGCDIQGCGNYGAPRGSRTHQGTDVKCNGGDIAYAPFPGTLVREAKPYGNGKCCDTGYLLDGIGDWKGYQVKVFYSKPDSDKLGKNITKGSRIGVHIGLHCGCYSTSMTDHAHFQFYKLTGGTWKIIDGTNFLTCSSTITPDGYSCTLRNEGDRVHETSSPTKFDCVDTNCINSCKGGQCVALVTCSCTRNGKHIPRTSCWRPGKKVVNADETCDTSIPANTAIATFTGNGYTGHAAIFIKCEGTKAVQVYDQWCSRSIGYRTYTSSSTYYDRYYVIKNSGEDGCSDRSSWPCRWESAGPNECPTSVPACGYSCTLRNEGDRVHETSSPTKFDCMDTNCNNTCKGGQCVALVTCSCTRNGNHIPRTSCWRPEKKVVNADGTCDTSIPANTAIATFTGNGYTGHAAIFIKCEGTKAVQVYDQWCSGSIGYRTYTSSSTYYDRYYVIKNSGEDGCSDRPSWDCRWESAGPNECPTSVSACP